MTLMPQPTLGEPKPIALPLRSESCYRKRYALRPVTIRQLAQVEIEEELTRNGSRHRYRLGGDEFSTVDLILPPGLFPAGLTSISQFTFVGHIVTIDDSGETTRTIRMVDGTGRIVGTTKGGPEAEQQLILR